MGLYPVGLYPMFGCPSHHMYSDRKSAVALDALEPCETKCNEVQRRKTGRQEDSATRATSMVIAT